MIAYHDSISISGVGFDIACGNYAVRMDLKMADVDEAFMPALAEKMPRNNCPLLPSNQVRQFLGGIMQVVPEAGCSV